MASPLEPHHPPAFFASGPSPFAKLIIFAAFSIAIMAVDARMEYLSQIRAAYIAFIRPLQAIASAPSMLYQNIADQLVTRENLMREVDRLRQEALRDSMKLQRYQSLEIENVHLRQLLSAAQTGTLSSKLAEIVDMGRDPFVHKVTVNLGSVHQIVPGQAVIDDKGVVGQVTNVYASSSEITLITDKSLSIPIQIERNGLRAVAFGHGRDYTLDLPYLPSNVDILKGDVLITSGIDGIYPEGLVVAKITSITQQHDSPFARIVALPVAGVMNHKQVLLLNIPQVAEMDTKINHEIAKINTDARQHKSEKSAQQKSEKSAINNETIVSGMHDHAKTAKATTKVVAKPANVSQPQANQRATHAPR